MEKAQGNASSTPTQFGTTDSADFELMTWTFQMPDDYRVVAGEFAIVPRATYDELLAFAEAFRHDLHERGLSESDLDACQMELLVMADAAIARATGRTAA